MSDARRPRWPWLLGAAALAMACTIAFASLRTPRGTPASADDVWQQAENDLKTGQIERAATALGDLAKLREPTPLDWFLRGQVAVARGQIDDALGHLAHVPDDHYMAAQARLLAGQTELRRNRVRLAEQLFKAALELDPRLIQAHRELIYIYGMQLRRAN